MDLIIENQLEVVALAEANSLDTMSLVNHLKLHGYEWKDVQISTKNDIRLLAQKEIDINPFKEEGHYSIYKIRKNGEVDCLFVVVHLLSKTRKSNEAQYNRANDVARELNKYEEEIFENDEKRTIVVGDFNMQPYEAGVCSGYGFNATMSANQASKITRKIDGKITYLYFNPIWSLMGANKKVQGSYYSSSDKDDHAIYWYSFDAVLLRPCFIELFNWEYFEIVERTQKNNFVPNTTIDKKIILIICQ
jgi:exonuclease III